MHPHRPANLRFRRGFTLIELIVVLLIIGVLATIVLVGYNHVTVAAKVAAAQANLRNIAQAAVVYHTLQDAPELTRAGFLAAGAQMSVPVHDGLTASGWTYLGMNSAPTSSDQFSIGFDDGVGKSPNDVGGTRAVILTEAAGTEYVRVVVYGSNTPSFPLHGGQTGSVPPGKTPGEVLGDPTMITPLEGGGNATPSSPGGSGSGGGGGQSADFGTMAATLTVMDAPDATGNWEWAQVELTSVPDGTVQGVQAGGLQMSCTVDVPFPASAGAITSWSTVTGTTGEADWGAANYTPPAGRTYTCTVEAQDASGTVLARKTVQGIGAAAPADPVALSDVSLPVCVASTQTQTRTIPAIYLGQSPDNSLVAAYESPSASDLEVFTTTPGWDSTFFTLQISTPGLTPAQGNLYVAWEPDPAGAYNSYPGMNQVQAYDGGNTGTWSASLSSYIETSLYDGYRHFWLQAPGVGVPAGSSVNFVVTDTRANPDYVTPCASVPGQTLADGQPSASGLHWDAEGSQVQFTLNSDTTPAGTASVTLQCTFTGTQDQTNGVPAVGDSQTATFAPVTSYQRWTSRSAQSTWSKAAWVATTAAVSASSRDCTATALDGNGHALATFPVIGGAFQPLMWSAPVAS